MKLEVAPDDTDVAVPRFAAVLEQEEFRAELDRLASSQWGWGTPQEVRVQPLKVHKRRCSTFEIAVNTTSGWHSVIGKVYTDDRSNVFQTMEAISRAGFGPEAEFGTPRPLTYLPAFHVLLEEKVPGRAATDVFLNGAPDERLAAAERCGRWLVRFHAAGPRLGSAAGPGDELPRFRRWRDRIASLGEPFAAKSERLYRKLEAIRPAAGSAERCAGHGSYIPEHVYLSAHHTAAIDLDEYHVGDPARDVAWFFVSLQRLALKHLGSLHALDEPAAVFLTTYVSSARPGAGAHFPFYRAAECLHRARRDLYERVPPAREWAEIMLDEGLRV